MAATKARMVGVWFKPERRPLTILLTTSFISLVSNQLTSLAVPWFVLVLTGSAAKMGLVAAATMLPSVVMMFLGGALADRMNERRLSAFSDIVSGVTVAMVPLLFALDYLNFTWLLILMVAGAIFDTPGYSARNKLIPMLAERGKVPIERVTSLQGVFQAVSMIFGAVLAGVLISWLGATNVLWINAAAFAVSAITMLMLIPEMHIPREAVPSVVEDIRAGLRYVRKHALLGSLIVTALIINGLLSPFLAVLIPYLAKTEWESATRFGLLMSGFGAGSLVGSVLVERLTERLGRANVVRMSVLLLTLPIFIFIGIPGLAVAWVGGFLMGIGTGMVNPVVFALVYRITEAEVLGRVQGVIGAGAMIASPLGVLLITPFLEQFGLSISFLIIGSSMVLFSVWLFVFSPFIREVEAVSRSLTPEEAAETEETEAETALFSEMP